MDDPTNGELSRLLDSTARQFGLDLTRHEKRISDVESEQRTANQQNDQKYVSAALYARDIAELKADNADLKSDLKDLKTTLDNNRRLVLTSLVLPVVVALIVFFVIAQAGGK